MRILLASIAAALLVLHLQAAFSTGLEALWILSAATGVIEPFPVSLDAELAVMAAIEQGLLTGPLALLVAALRGGAALGMVGVLLGLSSRSRRLAAGAAVLGGLGYLLALVGSVGMGLAFPTGSDPFLYWEGMLGGERALWVVRLMPMVHVGWAVCIAVLMAALAVGGFLRGGPQED